MDLRSNWKSVLLAVGVVTVGVLSLRSRRTVTNSLRQSVFSANPPSVIRLPTRTEILKDGGIDFRVSVALQPIQKPGRDTQRTTNPFLYPFEPGIHIKNFGRDYRLLFNKYCVAQKHVLIVSYQFQDQGDPLVLQDFYIAQEVCRDLDAFMFYNSGPKSGYSQQHKHMQVIPYQSTQIPINDYVLSNLKYEPFTLPVYQFKHFFHGIPNNADPDTLYNIYSKIKGLVADESYNLVMAKQWMLIVAREKEKAFVQFEVNSLGYLGLLLVRKQDDFEALRKIGPLAVLRDAANKI